MNWDFYGSFFFCYTLITTIGYGTFSPQSTGGKIFSAEQRPLITSDHIWLHLITSDYIR